MRLVPTKAICALGMLVAAFSATAGERRVVVVRDEGAIVRQASDLLSANLSRFGIGEAAVDQFDLAEIDKLAPHLAALRKENAVVGIVALGQRAIAPAVQLSGGKSVVVAVVSRASLETSRYPAEQVTAIVLDQPVDRLLNLIQVAMPEAHQVGILAGAATQKSLRQFEQRAQEHHLGVVSETVANSEELVPAADHLVPRVRVLLAIPDPVVHSRKTILPLLLTTYRAGVPVFAYSESYLQAGAAVALYSTPAQIAQQAAEVVAQVLDGKRPPSLLPPRYFTVGINSAVVRSLGISLPPAAEIEQRLQSLERAAGQ